MDIEIEETVLTIPENFEFPFPPYDIQKNFMESLYNAIENRKLGIFESPTGTGKSLSIICGAIRWLKDHNLRIHSNLNETINKLQIEKEKLQKESLDWLSTQSKEIEINYKLNNLKLYQKEIISYDEKIERIKQLKESKQKLLKNKFPKSNIKSIKSDNDQNQTNENLDEDDIILEENSEDTQNSDEDEPEPQYKPTKIYICSRTHSQLSQFIGEISKSPFSKNIRIASLASRQNYCINPQVQRLKNISLINEKCIDMQKKEKKTKQTDELGKTVKKKRTTSSESCQCPFFKQQQIQDLSEWILNEVQDIEDLVDSAKQLNACPYYASRKAAEDAEVVLIPYNTLLHKPTREANGIDLKDNIVIIDEAHNLLEALAQMYGCEVSQNQLESSLSHLKEYKQKYNTRFSAANLLNLNQLIFVVTKLIKMFDKAKGDAIYSISEFVLSAEIDNFNMFKLSKFCKDSRIAHKLRSFVLRAPLEPPKETKTGLKQFLSSIENKKGKSQPEPVEQPPQPSKPNSANALLNIISFLEALTYKSEDARIMLSKSSNQSKIQFLLLDPTSNFKDILQARSVIVAGGTMKPIAEFRNRLFKSSGASDDRIIEFSCDHIIPPQNILPIVMKTGEGKEKVIFNFEKRFSLGNSLKQLILRACNVIPGGVVVFFPSYSFENWFFDFVKGVEFRKPLFREPQSSKMVESVLGKYSIVIRKNPKLGALLFSVVGGKLSEGLNFSDDLGRCIVVVGMPYANIKSTDLKEKMNFIDKKEGVGAGQAFYEALCMKAVNQCIGRAVRHKNDFASVILFDERYGRASTISALPNWIKRSLKVCDYEEGFGFIKEFFEKKGQK